MCYLQWASSILHNSCVIFTEAYDKEGGQKESHRWDQKKQISLVQFRKLVLNLCLILPESGPLSFSCKPWLWLLCSASFLAQAQQTCPKIEGIFPTTTKKYSCYWKIFLIGSLMWKLFSKKPQREVGHWFGLFNFCVKSHLLFFHKS